MPKPKDTRSECQRCVSSFFTNVQRYISEKNSTINCVQSKTNPPKCHIIFSHPPDFLVKIYHSRVLISRPAAGWFNFDQIRRSREPIKKRIRRKGRKRGSRYIASSSPAAQQAAQPAETGGSSLSILAAQY